MYLAIRNFLKNIPSIPTNWHVSKPVICGTLFGILLLFLAGSLYSQNLIINEFVSSNFSTISDEDGDYEDWIEIYNAGDDPVDLKGFGLSDNSNNIAKWVFPAWVIQPGEYLVVWASGKDRKPVQGERVPGIARQMYRDISGTSVGNLINHPRFPDHPSFEEVLTDLFEAPRNIADNYGQRLHGYIKPPVTGNYTFWIASDDNGHLLLSTDHRPENAVKIAEVVDWTNPRQWNKYPGQQSQEIFLAEGHYYYISALMKEGIGNDNLAVRWQLPGGTIESPIPASRVYMQELLLHTNFRISADGEPLILSDAAGNIIDRVDPVEVPTDISFGRYPDTGNEWAYFYQPTPGAPNSDHIYLGRALIPQFSVNSGVYQNTFEVEITAPDEGGDIFYTTNSTEPTRQSNRYTEPLQIDKTTIVRARVFAGDLQPSAIATATYLMNENYTFPIVTVTTDPKNLYDRHHGMFVWSDPYWESNLFQKLERPANIAFFETDGSLGFSIDAGIRVHGGLTRGNPAKALAIMARNAYSTNSINYRLYDDKEIESFKNFVLRASGNDTHWTMFRDCMIHSLIHGRMDLEMSASRPAIVFLNGEYFGIRNIREKINEHYIAANVGIDDPETIDQLEYAHISDQVLICNGSADRFNQLIEYIHQHDLGIKENYEYVASQVDIDNFIQYNVAQIYFDNSDWPGNNNKWWGTEERKWRWLLFDTDFGFGLTPFGNETGDGLLKYKHNTLRLATATDGGSWPNPPHSTFLLRSLLKDESFRHQFINTFADHLNTSFLPARVDSIITAYQQIYEPEIMKHRAMFSRPVSVTLDHWKRDIQVMRDFGNNRPPHVRQHIRDYFNIERTISIHLDVNMPEGGHIRVNSIELTTTIQPGKPGFPWVDGMGQISIEYPWSGNYFHNIPIELEAKAYPGYTFSHWEGLPEGTPAMAHVTPDKSLQIKAHFVRLTDQQLLHYWHFNTLPDGTLTSVAADHSFSGNAAITYPGQGDGYMDRYGTGSSLNLHREEDPGYALRPRNPSYSRKLLLTAPSTGFKNIQVAFAVHRSNNGATQQAFYFSHDAGETWTMAGDPYDIHTDYTLFSFDLAGFDQVNDNPGLMFKILFQGENNTGSSGNNRFDNFSISGEPIHVAGHTITATAAENGTITPAGGILVEPGASQLFFISPANGYRILDLLVDGESMGALSSYVFTNVNKEHTIHALFDLDTHAGPALEQQTDVLVFPNPFSNKLFVEFQTPVTGIDKITYLLYDFYGQLQRTGIIETQSSSLSLEGLRSGPYFLIIANDGNPIKRVKLLRQ